MTTLEKHCGVYRIDFRFAGKRFRRSLKTESERTATLSLARAEENLRRLELGQLILPPGANVVSFILSDGRIEHRPTLKARPSNFGSAPPNWVARLSSLSKLPAQVTVSCPMRPAWRS